MIHEASEIVTKTKYNGNVVMKATVVYQYNMSMNLVDHSDHMLSTYVALKGSKWYQKLFLHIFNITPQ